MNELFESSYLSIMSAENDKLRKQLQQKENIIKEVREYIKEHIRIDDEYPDYMEMLIEEYDELLQMLDKENKDE